MVSEISIHDMVGYALVQACRAHYTRVRVLLNKLGLHPGQEMFLLSLWEEEGLAQTELADRLHVQRATVTNTVTRLEAVGLVRRQPDVEDGRIYRIYLTEEGKKVHEATRSIWLEMESAITNGLGDDEMSALTDLLARVTTNLSDTDCR
jgi:MarR family transcriptional regulator, organic hydroperoxide resistance regulator